MVARQLAQLVPVLRVLANCFAPGRVMRHAKAIVAQYTAARRDVRQPAWGLARRVALLPARLFANATA